MQDLILKKLEKKIEVLLLADFELHRLKKEMEGCKEEVNSLIELSECDDKEMVKIINGLTDKLIKKHNDYFEKHGVSLSCEVKVEDIED